MGNKQVKFNKMNQNKWLQIKKDRKIRPRKLQTNKQ